MSGKHGERQRVLAYRSDTEAVMDTYTFSQTVPALRQPSASPVKACGPLC